MVVVIALTESHQCNEGVVSALISGFERALAPEVADRVHAPGRVVHEEHSQRATPQERTQATGGLSAFLWGGALRVFFVHHATWSVNSVCHLWGKRPFETRDESRNNPLVALVGLGEGNHHNHHAFPRSAKHGLQPWQFDPTWWLIWTMEKTGLAWDVQRVSSQEMTERRR